MTREQDQQTAVVIAEAKQNATMHLYPCPESGGLASLWRHSESTKKEAGMMYDAKLYRVELLAGA